jgi:hypothetical protein
MFQRNFTVVSKVRKAPLYLYISREVSSVHFTYFKFMNETILSFSALATSIHGVWRNGQRGSSSVVLGYEEWLERYNRKCSRAQIAREHGTTRADSISDVYIVEYSNPCVK